MLVARAFRLTVRLLTVEKVVHLLNANGSHVIRSYWQYSVLLLFSCCQKKCGTFKHHRYNTFIHSRTMSYAYLFKYIIIGDTGTLMGELRLRQWAFGQAKSQDWNWSRTKQLHRERVTSAVSKTKILLAIKIHFDFTVETLDAQNPLRQSSWECVESPGIPYSWKISIWWPSRKAHSLKKDSTTFQRNNSSSLQEARLDITRIQVSL